MLGIVQEQHPDRAALFMQWKEMEWSVLVDALNLLEVPHVPITVALDEHGIVRHVGLSMEDTTETLRSFLATEYEAPDRGALRGPEPLDLSALVERARRDDTGEAWRRWGDAVALRGGPGRHHEAIAAYERAVERDPDDALSHFRLGVAYRMRHDSDQRRDADFRRAVEHWTRALDLNPNQYIFRRRIQQYGPRLEKPYPFYDWVAEARQEIRARGEEPLPLAVEPRGSEFAQPAETFAAGPDPGPEPDPEGRIHRDRGELIEVETVTVPARVEAGEVARVHIEFRPREEMKAHWNNEVDDLVFWIDAPERWEVESRRLVYPVPRDRTVSNEVRSLEVELRAPEEASGSDVRIPSYALYYVCEDVNGICMYRRQDVELQVAVREEG